MVQIDSFYPGIVFSSLFKIIGRLGFWRWYYLLLSYCFSKIILQQSLRPFRFPLQGTETFFTIKKGIFLPLRLSCKESSTFSPSPSSSGSGDVTALWCSEPLRYKVGGPIKGLARFAGWDRLGIVCYYLAKGAG